MKKTIGVSVIYGEVAFRGLEVSLTAFRTIRFITEGDPVLPDDLTVDIDQFQRPEALFYYNLVNDCIGGKICLGPVGVSNHRH